MRQTYIVSYDVCAPKRLRRVFKILRGCGDHLQLSVFRCELNHRELVELRSRLAAEIHHDEDHVRRRRPRRGTRSDVDRRDR